MSLGIRHGKRTVVATSLVAAVVLVAGLLAGCQRFESAPAQSAPAPTKSAAGQSAPAAGATQQAAPAQKLVVKFSHVVA